MKRLLAVVLCLCVSVLAVDDAKNFAKSSLETGISSSDTSLTVLSGTGTRFPVPPFNAVIWNVTDYADPSDAYYANMAEIVRVISKSSDTFQILRAQEGTAARNFNNTAKSYRITAPLTAYSINQFQWETPTLIRLASIGLGNSGDVIYRDSTGWTNKPASSIIGGGGGALANTVIGPGLPTTANTFVLWADTTSTNVTKSIYTSTTWQATNANLTVLQDNVPGTVGTNILAQTTVGGVTNILGLGSAAYSASGDFATAIHNQDASTITTGTLDGDRLPAMSASKRGGVPATGSPTGLFLSDGGWAAISGTNGGTVTGITAGAGLLGGTITSSGTFTADTNSMPINVKWYGADPTGATDSRTAIVASIAEAQTRNVPMYFPTGRYLIGSQIYLAHATNLTFIGDGPKKSWIYTTNYTAVTDTFDPVNGGLNTILMYFDGATNVAFRDIGFTSGDGIDPATDTYCYVTCRATTGGLQDISFDNCYFEGGHVAALWMDCDTTAHGVLSSGLAVRNCEFYRCCIWTNMYSGAVINGIGGNFAVTGNTFRNCGHAFQPDNAGGRLAVRTGSLMHILYSRNGNSAYIAGNHAEQTDSTTLIGSTTATGATSSGTTLTLTLASGSAIPSTTLFVNLSGFTNTAYNSTTRHSCRVISGAGTSTLVVGLLETPTYTSDSCITSPTVSAYETSHDTAMDMTVNANSATVIGNTWCGTGRSALVLSSMAATITGNVFSNAFWQTVVGGYLTGPASDILFTGNLQYRSGDDGYSIAMVTHSRTNRLIIRNNVFRSIHLLETQNHVVALCPAGSVIMEGNLIDGLGLAYVYNGSRDSVLRNNVVRFSNGTAAAITLGSASSALFTTCSVIGNTIYGSPSSGYYPLYIYNGMMPEYYGNQFTSAGIRLGGSGSATWYPTAPADVIRPAPQATNSLGGIDYSIGGGNAKDGSTNKTGGMLILRSGIPTGSGTNGVQVVVNTPNTASGSTTVTAASLSGTELTLTLAAASIPSGAVFVHTSGFTNTAFNTAGTGTTNTAGGSPLRIISGAGTTTLVVQLPATPTYTTDSCIEVPTISATGIQPGTETASMTWPSDGTTRGHGTLYAPSATVSGAISAGSVSAGSLSAPTISYNSVVPTITGGTNILVDFSTNSYVLSAAGTNWAFSMMTNVASGKASKTTITIKANLESNASVTNTYGYFATANGLSWPVVITNGDWVDFTFANNGGKDGLTSVSWTYNTGGIHSPNFDPGLVVWLETVDALGVNTSVFTDAGTTLANADAQSIYQWNDWSGNGYNLVQSGPSDRPLWKTGISPTGLPVVRFDGLASYMQASPNWSHAAVARSVSVVLKNASSSTYKYVMDSGTGRFAIGIPSASATSVGWYDNAFSWRNSTNAVDTTAFHSYTFNLPAGSDGSVYRDSTLLGPTGLLSTASAIGGTTRVGSVYNASGNFLNADLCVLIIKDHVMGAQELARHNAYIKNKWGTP